VPALQASSELRVLPAVLDVLIDGVPHGLGHALVIGSGDELERGSPLVVEPERHRLGHRVVSRDRCYYPTFLNDPPGPGSCASATTPDNSASCSLRQPLVSGAPGDTISLAAARYTLSQGSVHITDGRTVVGAGARATVIARGDGATVRRTGEKDVDFGSLDEAVNSL